MTRRTRAPFHPGRAISTFAFAVSLLGVGVAWPSAAAAARVAQAHAPGVIAAALGGDVVVNRYGVAGLGLFQMALDNGSSVAGVCIQADVSHSTAASQRVAIAGVPAQLAVDIPLPAAPTSTTTTTSSTSTSTTTSTTWPSSTTTTGEPTAPSSPVPPDMPATGGAGRWVVRIGALLFALGSIATYVAAGTRRNPVRDVDLDGRDL